MLGPPNNDAVMYKEVGRCIATLMADEVFHDVAYRARDRVDLLAGIDEFLEQTTVLPPGKAVANVDTHWYFFCVSKFKANYEWPKPIL